ncbi:hypothetical protein LEMLEM_LOCUS19842 [Lemmus lemmus]
MDKTHQGECSDELRETAAAWTRHAQAQPDKTPEQMRAASRSAAHRLPRGIWIWQQHRPQIPTWTLGTVCVTDFSMISGRLKQ